MNKLYFGGQVVNLNSEDYQYMQDAISAEISGVVRTLYSANATTGGILLGFTLGINPTTPDLLTITHASGRGAFFTEKATFIYTSTGFTNIALSDYNYGAFNYVYAQGSVVYGSYDQITETNVVGAKLGIDYSNYQLVYNRQLDNLAIVVYTAAEYALLPLEDKQDLVYLGYAVSRGPNQAITTINTDGVIEVHIPIPESIIEVANLSADFMLPQDMIQPTTTSAVNDGFYGTPSDIIGDLNRIRTEIRAMKGTNSWTSTAPGTLANYDKSFNETQADGLIEFGNNLSATISTSSGYEYINIHTGKLFHYGNIYDVQTTSSLKLSDFTLITTGFPGNIDDFNAAESIAFSPPYPYTYTISKKIQGYSIVPDSVSLYPYVFGEQQIPPEYYDVNYTAGTITFSTSTGYINNYKLFYEYTQPQYDSVHVTSTGALYIATGAPSLTPSPIEVLSSDYRLYNILRLPYIPTSYSSIADCRNYIHTIRNCIEVPSIITSNKPRTTNAFTYYTAAGLIDISMTQWSLISNAYAITNTHNASMHTTVLCKNNDELWLRASKLMTTGSVTISYETSTGGAYTSVVVNLAAAPAAMHDCYIFVAKGLSTGYHDVIITNNTSSPIHIYGIVYGRLDTLFLKDNFITNNADIDNLYVTSSMTLGGQTIQQKMISYSLVFG